MLRDLTYVTNIDDMLKLMLAEELWLNPKKRETRFRRERMVRFFLRLSNLIRIRRLHESLPVFH